MLYVDEKRCSGCGLCVDVCPVEAITLQDDVAAIDQNLCTECEACAATCPEAAILTLTEPALDPHVEREIAPYERQQVTVPLATRLAPAIGSALFFLGREVVPRVADYVLDALDRRMTPGSIGSRGDTRATPGEGETSGGGRRLRRRHRG
ncbi:MAG: 4Fe-4S binding protein [Anaerolineae bacterium]